MHLGVRAAPGLLPPVLAWALVGSTLVDDAHLTFGAARALAEQGQVLNHAGAAVEQSSSLLHVVVLAGLHRLTGLPLPVLAWGVGVVAAGALAVLAAGLAERHRPGTGWLAGALVGSSAGVVVWAAGGLETTLAALALLGVVGTWVRWFAARTVGAAGWVGAATLAWCLVRPEAPAVLLAMALGLAAVALVAGRRELLVGLWLPVLAAVLASLAVVGVRLAWFGAALPQPVATKAGGLHVERGLRYLLARLGDDPLLVVLLVVGVVAVLVTLARRRDDLAVVPAVAGLAVVAFAVAAGGDWMPGPRLLVPAVAPLVVVAATWLGRRRAVVGLLLAVQAVGLVLMVQHTSVGSPAWERGAVLAVADTFDTEASWPVRASRIGLRDLPAVAELQATVDTLAPQVPGTVLVASHQAGLLADRALRGGTFVDLAVLSEDRFADCRDLLVETIFGRVMPWQPWLASRPPCGVPRRPDVVFGLGTLDRIGAAAADYRLVHASSGTVLPPGSPGPPVSGAAFVAVRGDLLDDDTSPPVRRVDFDRLLGRDG